MKQLAAALKSKKKRELLRATGKKPENAPLPSCDQEVVTNPNSCVQSCVQNGLEGGSVEAAAVTSSDLVQLVSGMRKLLQYAENTGFEGLPSTVESTLERLSPPNNKERQIAEEGLEPPTRGL